MNASSTTSRTVPATRGRAARVGLVVLQVLLAAAVVLVLVGIVAWSAVLAPLSRHNPTSDLAGEPRPAGHRRR